MPHGMHHHGVIAPLAIMVSCPAAFFFEFFLKKGEGIPVRKE